MDKKALLRFLETWVLNLKFTEVCYDNMNIVVVAPLSQLFVFSVSYLTNIKGISKWNV